MTSRTPTRRRQTPPPHSEGHAGNRGLQTTTLAAVEAERAHVYDLLGRRDEGLAGLIARYGRPDPFSWEVLDDTVDRDAFSELALHIVSQQISTLAALAIFTRIQTLLGGGLEPAQLVLTPVEELRAAGVSNAKARSLRDLAERVADGRISFKKLAGADDATAEAELRAVLGVGPWSAQMFLLHYYRRPDILPMADVGLLRAAQSAFSLPARPAAEELGTRGERWRPFRSYAAALLWAHGRDLARPGRGDGR